VFVQLPEDFALETEKIKKAVTGDTRVMCVCNPHSPSGTLYSKESLLDLIRFCHKKDIIFSVDENYIEFAEKGQDTTLASFVKEYENLFVIRSVTKFYGMPGIRLGYGIAARNLIDKLEAVRQPWSINSLAGYATLAAFNDTDFIENTKKTIAKEREVLAKNLNEIRGLQVYPSVTNFVLVKILGRKITSTKLKELLAEDHMLIRDCCTFMGLDDSFFRITVRAAEDNQKLVCKIKEILHSLN
jgi:threonine-phosphate decarboxylase